MIKKEKENNNSIKGGRSTNNMAESSFWFSEWLGAIFYYLMNFGETPFNDLSKVVVFCFIMAIMLTSKLI